MKKKEETTPKVVKEEKTPKKVKEAKTVQTKKLPRLFKKSYSEKSLEKKIYKKIYIDSDKAILQSLFKVDPKSEGKKVTKYKIPRDTQIAMKDAKRLKKVAKDIKKQKGRFRVVPFVAVVSVIAAIGICVTIFKNPLLKKLITDAMESVFEAKCDIDRVNLEIFGARFEVDRLQQANKNDTMKNLFEIGKIDLHFNLTQLLRGRFVAENIEVSGVDVGTERKKDGSLPPAKRKALEEKKRKEAEKNDEAGFFAALSEKSGTAAQASLAGLFDSINQYNPEVVFKEVQSQLQTPAVSKEVETKVKELVATYQGMPEKIEKDIASFSTTAQELANINVSSANPAEIAALITKVKSAIDEGKRAKELVDSSVKGVQKDTDTVKALSDKLTAAVKNDTALVDEKAKMYINFSFDDATRMVTGAMDTYLLGMLGDYYPYLQKAINSVGSTKSSGSSSSSAEKDKSTEKEKKPAKATKKQGRRLYGRDITWKKDAYPSFLIKRAFASGPVFDAKLLDISNDMDKWGKPAAGNCNFTVGNTKHGAKLTVDARKSSKEPLIKGDYNGSNIALKMDMSGGNESAQGVPTFDGTSAITAEMTADENFAFTIGGKLLMNPLKVTATAFENEKINSIYQNALSTIKKMDLGFTIGFDQSSGIKLNLNSDIDKIVANALKGTLQKELEGMKDQVAAKTKEELAKYTGGATSQLSQFTDISSALKDKQGSVDKLNSLLTNKLTELTKAQTSGAVKSAIPSNIPLPSSGSNSSSSSGSAQDAAKNLLKGFKR